MAKKRNIFYKMANQLATNKEVIKSNIKKDIFDNYKTSVKEMIEEAAEAFYSDYSPTSYKRHTRKPTLANMYRIHIGSEIYVELGGEFSTNKHRVSNDYIYEKMFKGGWHGGSTDNKSPETLWYSRWNDVNNSWDSWNRPAERMRGDTPYDIFMQQYDNYLNTEFPAMVESAVVNNILKLFK